ncbi:Smr/MutS family protein [Sediminimonas qiaohouensis]|uniref:Smr/MutS family protein n=1 Tax=Sediminimonas qiaohouensis TaxID=552061 RepID=UPI00047A9549|nr:Smr/MutS family protein [Sediminimonas qiaohouensis]
MSRRKLRPEEIELWRQVAETAERLHPEKGRNEGPKPRPKPEKKPARRIDGFTVGQNTQPFARTSKNLSPTLSEELRSAPVRMDKKAFTKLRRGKLRPEARIDLHGMTMDRAHGALTAFILKSQAQGRRLVLVITGKGKERDSDGPIPARRGVLRHQVPHWLSVPPLAQAVLQVSQAHISHGGEGAYYVYLRRGR